MLTELSSHQVTFGPRAKITLAVADKCIYCGATGGQLTDEHIIPDGLGADYIVERASCKDCMKIIDSFESNIITSVFGPMRDILDIKSRKRPNKPSRKGYRSGIPSEAMEGLAPTIRTQMDVSSLYEILLIVIDYGGLPPMISVGPARCGPGEFVIFGDPPKHASAIEFWSSGANFERFLCKISHAYCYATLGPTNFIAMTTKIILGQDHTGCEAQIGSYIRAESDALHEIALFRTALLLDKNTGLSISGLYLVRIRFFASKIPIEYFIVVGCDPWVPVQLKHKFGVDLLGI